MKKLSSEAKLKQQYVLFSVLTWSNKSEKMNFPEKVHQTATL